ncbi:uncharacterized protein LOC128997189 [Macrosteles quadrilineatus]|uniref:uncharacterized protein LOC128997189 n=1 Tax=Macrosteles quadrilineatus TaxID=74068 RepID=UPI0023E169C6|nr:uncharacterized protein LOC128997189 [Macrosteles quadrilineatus]
MDVRSARLWLGLALATLLFPHSTPDPSRAHDRRKRFIWLTNDGRIALPPGSSLTITPSLALPFVRYPPEGFLSNMSISIPFTILFDSLGLTDNQNPYGVLPPIFARSLGRMSGSLLADYIAQLLEHKRGKRAAPERPPYDAFHGGERAILYTIAEEFLENFGMDGHACLLRAICEVHGQPDHKYGLLGEVVKLFFTASKSPYAHLLDDYVDAERTGMEDGECWKFYKACSKSLFHYPSRNKYKDPQHSEEEEEETSKPIADTSWYKGSSAPKPTAYQNSVYSDKKKPGTKKIISPPDKRFM